MPPGACIHQGTLNHSMSPNRRNLVLGISYPGDGRRGRKERLSTAERRCQPRAGWKSQDIGPPNGWRNLNRAACWELASRRRGVPDGTWNHRGSAAARGPSRDSARQGKPLWLLSSYLSAVLHCHGTYQKAAGKQSFLQF